MDFQKMDFVRCDHCYGLSYVGGVYPRNGMTRQELIERVHHRGHVNAQCRHCGRVATLRLVEERGEAVL